MIKVLSEAQVLFLHDALIKRFGGAEGILNKSMLKSALQSGLVTFDGKDLFPTDLEKIVRISYGLITNHAFRDGNKRVGIGALILMLEENGINIKISHKDLIGIGYAVGSGTMDYEKMLDKIRKRLQEKLILDESLFENISIEKQLPQYLYHATYPHRWKMIKQAGGLKTHLNRKLRNWSDSRNVICLSEDPDVAESYAETALDELDKDWDIIILKIDTKYLDKNYLSYDANILYAEEDAEEGFEQSEYEYSKDIPLEAISLTLVEAAKRKKRKKRISDVKAGDPIFKSVNDMKNWIKKRQKGLSPFCYLNPNAGNVPLSNSIFNSIFSGDGSSGVGTSEGGVSNGGLSAGDAGGGMGESWYLGEANKHKSKNANQNAIKDLKWYETPAGNLPAKDFYDNCNPYIKKLFDNLFKLLKNNQLAQIKDCSKLLDSKEHIFELRLKDGDFWYRLTYFRADDGNILLTGFTKKRNETDDIEIQKAIKCKKNYLLYRRGQNIDVK